MVQAHLRYVCAVVSIALSLPGRLPAQQLKLETEQRYGWEDPAGPVGSTPVQRRLDGGMLTNVGDLAEAADGSLYVLDNWALKVVVFDRSGTVRQVIGNGKGAGPGEFTRPSSIALAKNGDLYVVDGGQSRVSVFGADGKFRRSFVIASPLVSQMRIVGDRLYLIQYIFQSRAPALLVYDTTGKLIEKRFPPSEEDAAFGRTGNSYRMALLRDGKLGIAHLNPGTWTTADDPARTFGASLVPGNAVKQVTSSGVWVAPAVVRGFGELRGGLFGVLYERLKPETIETPEHPRWNLFLTVLRADGTIKGSLDVAEQGRVFLVARDGQTAYLTAGEPFLSVVRYRIVVP